MQRDREAALRHPRLSAIADQTAAPATLEPPTLGIMSKHLARKTASEPATAEPTQFTLLLDEDLSRITQWLFQPGDQTGQHLQIRLRDRTTIKPRCCCRARTAVRNGRPKAGLPSCAAPVEHNATNVSDVRVRNLEIEYI